jgi:hypothetical protein
MVFKYLFLERNTVKKYCSDLVGTTHQKCRNLSQLMETTRFCENCGIPGHLPEKWALDVKIIRIWHWRSGTGQARDAAGIGKTRIQNLT